MKKFLTLCCVLFAFLAVAPLAHADESYFNWCMIGNTKVKSSGLQSTNTVQASYPKCLVHVYAHGTQTLSTIYSDNGVTPLANPFTANQDGSYNFYAADGNYDVTMSGGLNGGFPQPFTIPNIFLTSGGSGPPSNPVVFQHNGVNLIQQLLLNFNDTTPAAPSGDPNILFLTDSTGKLSGYLPVSGGNGCLSNVNGVITSNGQDCGTGSGGGGGIPDIRGFNTAVGTNVTQLTIALPAGAVAGDLVVLFEGSAYSSTIPTGFTTITIQQPATWSHWSASKILDSSDITAGGFTIFGLGSTLGSDPQDGVMQIVEFKGAVGGIREGEDKNTGGGAFSSTAATVSTDSVNTDAILFFNTQRNGGTNLFPVTTMIGGLPNYLQTGVTTSVLSSSSSILADMMAPGGTFTTATTYPAGCGAECVAIQVVVENVPSVPGGPGGGGGGGGGGSGTVTSVATSTPLSGGPITTSGTLSCPTCVTSTSPAAGIAHFAGSTQTVTSSPVSLVGDITGILPVANGGSGTATPGLVAGSGISLSGSWPTQTISAPANVSSINSSAGAFTFSFSAGAGSCSGTTCTFTGSGTGGGSVTNFIANSASWPTWLVPSVATGSTTPTLSVAASTIPVSAGGTGTTTPTLTAGTGISITGTWPNQTIIAPGSGVSSLNSLAGALNLVAGSNVTITPSGSNITIASTGGGGGAVGPGTTGVYPIFATTTTIGNGHLDENTTPGSITSSLPLAVNDGSGLGGTFAGKEGTAPAGVVAQDILWADSATHRFRVSYNGASALTLATLSDFASPTAFGVAKCDNTTITCAGGVFTAVGGGGGAGTVTSVSTGGLSPLFTAAIANPTTTPALSFTLSTAPAHSVFGNLGASTAAPSFNASGGGTTNFLRADGTWAAPPGSTISSVSNSDGTLTISPTTGAVVGSLNLAHANTFTAAQSAPSFTTTGVTNGAINFTANGSLPTAPSTNQIQITAPNAATSYALELPNAQPTTNNTYWSCTAANPSVCTFVGLKAPTYTVSTLPSASTAGAGTIVTVSDATTFTAGTCTGGGSDRMLAVSDGTAWSCH